RDLDLMRGIERAPPLASRPVQRSLRLGGRYPPDQARRLVGVVVAFNLGRHAGAPDLAGTHPPSLEPELWSLDGPDAGDLVERVEHGGHGMPGSSCEHENSLSRQL